MPRIGLAPMPRVTAKQRLARKPAKWVKPQPMEEHNSYGEVLEPDEDFYYAISADEFKGLALEMVRRVHEQYGKK